jgi:hypothetical protein
MMANAMSEGVFEETLGVVTALPNLALTAPHNVHLAHAAQARK